MAPTFTESFFEFISAFGGSLLAWSWLIVLWLILRIIWEVYKLLKQIDYVSAIAWSYLQVTIPADSLQTPKAMENAFEVWGGIHKSPDVFEKYFEGYMEAWYSCELQCTRERIRYILVVPSAHRNFFEGVVYGQYPTAEIKEVEDYTLRYHYEDLDKKFDLFGSEIILAADDIYPIRTYDEYEDPLAEEERFIDPHQAVVEAFTNSEEGEEFWMQLLIRPIDSKSINKWAAKGEKEVAKIAGSESPTSQGLLGRTADFFLNIPAELVQAALEGPVYPGSSSSKDSAGSFHLYTPVDEAKMKGILQKIGRNAFRVKIRIMYLSPPGRFRKPAMGTAIGAFKQFGTYHLNSLKPDSATKTNGPNYILKDKRRKFRKRRMLLNFQFRDFWGVDSGQMMTAKELATLYHFPNKYVRAPLIERAVSGLGSAPENLPYI